MQLTGGTESFLLIITIQLPSRGNMFSPWSARAIPEILYVARDLHSGSSLQNFKCYIK